MPRLSARRILFDRGGLVCVAALALYIAIAPTYIVDGDNAEMAALGAAGGVAHPTGYPAYLLWLRITSWLPGVSPVHTAAIATTILAATALFVLHAACRAWGARPLAASVTVAMFGAAPIVLRYSSEAETFAMNNLVVALVVWLSAQAGPLHGKWRVAVLGLVGGIGIGDHVTCILVAPIGVLGVVRGVREAGTGSVVAIMAGLGSLALGLSTYVYLLATPENSMSWRQLTDARDLVDHLLRRAYGGAGSFSPHGGDLHVTANVVALAQTLGRTWLWLPLVGGFAVFAYKIARPTGESRAGWICLGASFLIAGPALAARFDLEPTSLNLYVVERFHLLPALLLAPPIAIGLDRAGDVVAPHVRLRSEALLTIIVIVAFAAEATAALPRLASVRSPAIDHGLRAMFANLPADAVVILSGDVPYLGSGYLQVAEHVRPDVVIVLWHFVGVRWFRDRLVRRGIPIDPREDGKPSVRIAEGILATGRPLFVDNSLGNVLQELPSYPYGTLFRVLPRKETTPRLDEVVELNRRWFASLDLDYPLPGPDDDYPTMIHVGYASTWRILADAYAAAGRRDDARQAAELARQLGPQP